MGASGRAWRAGAHAEARVTSRPNAAPVTTVISRDDGRAGEEAQAQAGHQCPEPTDADDAQPEAERTRDRADEGGLDHD